MMLTTTHFVIGGAVLFAIGAAGVVARRTPEAIVAALQLLFTGCVVLFAAFARMTLLPQGKAAALVVIVIALLEGIVVLALAMRRRRSRME